MGKILVLMLFAFSAVVFANSFSAFAQGLLDEEQIEQFLIDHEILVDDALDAFNREDAEVFFKDWPSSMAAVATEQTFKNMYVNTYKKQFGNFISKALARERCAFVEGYILVVYKAEFEKDASVQISVNFTKEEDVYKIMQIRFDDM